jgi:hypothetical protein
VRGLAMRHPPARISARTPTPPHTAPRPATARRLPCQQPSASGMPASWRPDRARASEVVGGLEESELVVRERVRHLRRARAVSQRRVQRRVRFRGDSSRPLEPRRARSHSPEGGRGRAAAGGAAGPGGRTIRRRCPTVTSFLDCVPRSFFAAPLARFAAAAAPLRGWPASARGRRPSRWTSTATSTMA